MRRAPGNTDCNGIVLGQVYLEVTADSQRREVERLTYQLQQERFNLQDIQTAINKVQYSRVHYVSLKSYSSACK
jgi:hypothetical protein